MFLFNYYKQLFLDNRKWLKIISVWFLVCIILGAISFFSIPSLLDAILQTLQDRFGANPDLNLNLASQIFLQNLLSSAIALLGGIVFGIGPILVMGVNGFIFGFILSAIVFSRPEGLLNTLAFVVSGIVPHGIFEIPAVLLAAGIGLKLGTELLSKATQRNRLEVFKQNFKQAVFSFPGIALLLVIAALIEVFVSGKLVNNF